MMKLVSAGRLDRQRLCQRLSALGATNGKASEILNEYIREGKGNVAGKHKSALEEKMVKSDTSMTQVEVSLKLAKQIFSRESNLVFSPLSINIILSLIAVGANGPVLDQLLGFLKSKSTADLNAFYSQIMSVILGKSSSVNGPCLSMANGAWVEQTTPFNPSFKHVADSVYKAVSESVDFRHKAKEVANQVNLWVEKETKGLIKEILPVDIVTEDTRLILANALYFKGIWAEKFDKYYTTHLDFHLLNGKSLQVPFMESDKSQCVEVYNGFKALRLPYKSGSDDYMRRRFSMYIFLPDAKDGLPSLIDKACSNPGFLEQHLPEYGVELKEFRIPKFKISFSFEASEVLKELGLVLPFDEEGGGLTEMVLEKNGVFVSKIFHKAFIEVNEDGTEAAAATVAVMKAGCGMYEEPQVTFVADHPFMFFIRDDLSGVILFIGTLLNPLSP